MKLWGSRFTKSTDKAAFDFQSSIAVDSRLYEQDIMGSIAYAKTLAKAGIISSGEAERIGNALVSILSGLKTGKLKVNPESEDIHTYIEKLLTDELGDTAKRLHTGRSRNDQVATDLRIYLKEAVFSVIKLLVNVEKIFIKIAEDHTETILPGYTHMQKAQPVTLAHHVMAYFQMFKRDIGRLADAAGRMDVMPLGSGALAGTAYDIDRYYAADQLGFGSITANSLDAVSDRDFCIESVSCLSIVMMHLSRFCEEIVIWSSNEFGYIEIDDSYCTGSSIMPQKKNPDIAELIRGKTGRVYGSLVSLLTMMKALPLAYNKDMQEDKEAVFDAFDTVIGCLEVFAGMTATLKFNAVRMYDSVKSGYMNATDLADYLAGKGVAFRDAHEITGRIVLYAAGIGVRLEDMSLDELQGFSQVIGEDVYARITPEACVAARRIPGGTAGEAVLASIRSGGGFIADWDKTFKKVGSSDTKVGTD